MGKPKAKKPWYIRRVDSGSGLIINPTGRSGGNHEKRQIELIAQGRITIVPGAIKHIKVEHDDWCGLLVGSQYCNCHPTIDGIPWDD